MGNRSKIATAAGAGLAAGVVARARRRARLRAAGRGFVEDVMPSVLEPLPTADAVDEAHAPGHRHLPRKGSTTGGARLSREWARQHLRRRFGLHLPGRG